MQPQNSRFKKAAYLILGSIALVLTYIGLIMPGIPTTPFLLLTAYFYLRSSDKMYNWLLQHRIFGRILREFNENGTVSLRLKLFVLLPFWGSILVAEIWLLSAVWARLAMLLAGIGVTIAVIKWKQINLQKHHTINPVSMEVKYTYISSADYINSLEFDYIETYSLQRGDAEFDKRESALNAEYLNLSNKKASGKNLTAEQENRYHELYEFYGVTQFLVNAEGDFHPSSRKTNTFSSAGPEVKLLKEILQTEAMDIPMWMCAPVYRDAIVFYDAAHHVVSVLNICFSCGKMAIRMFHEVNADVKTYGLLHEFFMHIGHEIEKNEDRS